MASRVKTADSPGTAVVERLIEITRRLSSQVDHLRFAQPVTHVYNPLDYAWAPHSQYLSKYGGAKNRTILLGMNPGPFGMAQVGVPFGEVSLVKEWLGIRGNVVRPVPEHPARPVLGFECTRSEVSGARLWGWAKDRFETPERFFERYFVINYCPLVFMGESGKNITPDKLPAAERKELFESCDSALRDMCEVLEPQRVIGVGSFALARATAALLDAKIPTGQILHPSPASPKANTGWARIIEEQLGAMT